LKTVPYEESFFKYPALLSRAIASNEAHQELVRDTADSRILFEGQHILISLLNNLGGNGSLGSSRINGDTASFQHEQF
jgi:hypothetical protein